MEKSKKQVLLRIPVGIVCWIIIKFWAALIIVLIIFQFLYALFTTKKNKTIANMANQFIAYLYSVLRYMTFTTNIKPFPFGDMEKPLEKVNSKE